MENCYYSCEQMELDLDNVILYDPDSSLEGDENDQVVEVQGITFQICY